MTDVEKDILARFTALDSIVSFLLAKHLRTLSTADSKQLASSFMGTEHSLKTGLMDAADLEDIAERIEAALTHIISHAQYLEKNWRQQAGE